MPEMTAKEYLRQVYHIDMKLKRLEDQRDDLRQNMYYNISSPSGNMSAEKVQSSITGDGIEKLIAKVDALERDILLEMNRLIDAKYKIVKQIETLDDDRYKTILMKRYILLESWEVIAVDMGYRIKWVYKLHGKALQEFGEKWGIKSENAS